MNSKKKTAGIAIVIGIVAVVIVAIVIGVMNGKSVKTNDNENASKIEAQDSDSGEKDSQQKEANKLQIKGAELLDTATAKEDKKTVYAVEKVNVRTQPNTSSEVFKVASFGEEFLQLACDQEWSLVQIENKNYYIAKAYLTEDIEVIKQKEAEIKEQQEKAAQMVGSSGTGITYNLSANHIVAIDPGHQGRGNSSTEPNGPGSNVYKAKVASGTTGATTGLTEYQLNLNVALKLRDILLQRGYGVVMIRETNEVDISNAQRAQLAQAYGADTLIRIHANGVDNSSVSGILTMCMSPSNPYNAHLYQQSRRLSETVLDGMVALTGANKQGVSEVDNMTGINWATMPVTIVEMGYMTNPTEEQNLATDAYQQKIAEGIANGIDAYYR